jgi:hypothetical protein
LERELIVLDDVRFEAAFLRAGLLVGLIHERDVPDWAALRIGSSSALTSELAEVVGTRVELSAMREALRSIGESVEEHRVVAALLTAVADLAIKGGAASDQLHILGQIKREFALPASTAVRIKEFEDRTMLAKVGMQGQFAPGAEELAAWLDEVREPGFFRFYFDGADEAGAFVAALSRKVARDRRWGDRPRHAPAQAWLLRDPAGQRIAVVLNESAFAIVLREFAPVPQVSRIPYGAPGDHAIPVVHEATVFPLGSEEAKGRLAV